MMVAALFTQSGEGHRIYPASDDATLSVLTIPVTESAEASAGKDDKPTRIRWRDIEIELRKITAYPLSQCKPQRRGSAGASHTRVCGTRVFSADDWSHGTARANCNTPSQLTTGSLRFARGIHLGSDHGLAHLSSSLCPNGNFFVFVNGRVHHHGSLLTACTPSRQSDRRVFASSFTYLATLPILRSCLIQPLSFFRPLVPVSTPALTMINSTPISSTTILKARVVPRS